MRTRITVTLDNDILVAARTMARDKSVSLGTVLSDLVRRGLREPATLEKIETTGFPVFKIPNDAHPITLYDVRSAEDDA
ncbi:MAG: hypothetical protein AMXMBFR84_41960 [Candidatus Hydrogenedentota bacterium]